MVYVTLERMFPGDGSQPDPMFMAMASERKLGLFAIDEAHCIFSWQCFRYIHAGSYKYVLIYTFIYHCVYLFCRPAYRHLLDLSTYFPYVPVMALSATATPSSFSSLEAALSWISPMWMLLWELESLPQWKSWCSSLAEQAESTLYWYFHIDSMCWESIESVWKSFN